jgi:hypothetical protein
VILEGEDYGLKSRINDGTGWRLSAARWSGLADRGLGKGSRQSCPCRFALEELVKGERSLQETVWPLWISRKAVHPAIWIDQVLRVYADDSRFREGNAKEPKILVGYLLIASLLWRAEIAAVQFSNVDLQSHTCNLAEKRAQTPFAKL